MTYALLLGLKTSSEALHSTSLTVLTYGLPFAVDSHICLRRLVFMSRLDAQERNILIEGMDSEFQKREMILMCILSMTSTNVR